MRARWAVLAAMVIAAVAVPAARAQTDVEILDRVERQLRQFDSDYRLTVPSDQPISERLLLQYGGTLRFALISADNVFGESRTLRQYESIFYLRADLDGAHRFFGRARILYDDFNTGDSFDGRGDELREPIIDRYWYEFDLRSATMAATGTRSDWNLNAKVGRQYLLWESGLSLNDVLYAGQLKLEFGDFLLTGLASQTPSTGTVDFDGSRPGFDRDTDRRFWGGQVQWRGSSAFQPYVSALIQRDRNDRNFTTVSTPFFDYPTFYRYNSEYWSIGSIGSLSSNLIYRAEFVYQTGDTMSSPIDDRTGLPVRQTVDDIEAWATMGSLIWLGRDAFNTRVEFDAIAGSGDSDRLSSSDTFGGNRSGTTDNAFNSLGYVNTGLALAPRVTNLLSLRLGVTTSPTFGGALRPNQLRFGLHGFLFGKIDADAPISVPTVDESFVGGEIDVHVDWRVMSDLYFIFRYGVFIPGDAMPSNQNDARHFAYGGLTYAF